MIVFIFFSFLKKCKFSWNIPEVVILISDYWIICAETSCTKYFLNLLNHFLIKIYEVSELNWNFGHTRLTPRLKLARGNFF